VFLTSFETQGGYDPLRENFVADRLISFQGGFLLFSFFLFFRLVWFAGSSFLTGTLPLKAGVAFLVQPGPARTLALPFVLAGITG